MKEGIITDLQYQKMFFFNTLESFSEKDSSFYPQEGMLTVAQHVGHAAETIDWFLEGVFGSGFEMDFNNFQENLKKYKSFDECVSEFTKATDRAIAKIKAIPDEELMSPITGEIMKGAPKFTFAGALSDHTAHHRGALAVYARLLGKTPKMPYEGV